MKAEDAADEGRVGRIIPPVDMPDEMPDLHTPIWISRSRAWGEAAKAWTLCAVLALAGGIVFLVISPADPRAPDAPPGQVRLEATVRPSMGDPRSGPVTYRMADRSGIEWEIVSQHDWDVGDPVWIFVRGRTPVSASSRSTPREVAFAGVSLLVIIAAVVGAIAASVRLHRSLRTNPYPAD